MTDSPASKGGTPESFIEAMAVAATERDRSGVTVPDRPGFEVRHLESAVTLDLPIPERERLDTTDKFNRRLAELRKQYAPFLRNLAPALRCERRRTSLDTFAFRFEDDEDLRDASRPWSDEGDWEEVAVPHYRGPHGRWAAYYRTRFTTEETIYDKGRVWLIFRGVDYKARVFLNGHYIGSHEGFFGEFSFDVTTQLHRHEENTLLVRVENDAIQMGNHS